MPLVGQGSWGVYILTTAVLAKGPAGDGDLLTWNHFWPSMQAGKMGSDNLRVTLQ